MHLLTDNINTLKPNWKFLKNEWESTKPDKIRKIKKSTPSHTHTLYNLHMYIDKEIPFTVEWNKTQCLGLVCQETHGTYKKISYWKKITSELAYTNMLTRLQDGKATWTPQIITRLDTRANGITRGSSGALPLDFASYLLPQNVMRGGVDCHCSQEQSNCIQTHL